MYRPTKLHILALIITASTNAIYLAHHVDPLARGQNITPPLHEPSHAATHHVPEPAQRTQHTRQAGEPHDVAECWPDWIENLNRPAAAGVNKTIELVFDARMDIDGWVNGGFDIPSWKPSKEVVDRYKEDKYERMVHLRVLQNDTSVSSYNCPLWCLGGSPHEFQPLSIGELDYPVEIQAEGYCADTAKAIKNPKQPFDQFTHNTTVKYGKEVFSVQVEERCTKVPQLNKDGKPLVATSKEWRFDSMVCNLPGDRYRVDTLT